MNVIVVGGENNPLWLTTVFRHTQSASINKWRPKGAIKRTWNTRPGTARSPRTIPRLGLPARRSSGVVPGNGARYLDDFPSRKCATCS
jgi:hypothetical protein